MWAVSETGRVIALLSCSQRAPFAFEKREMKLIVCDRCHKPQPDAFVEEFVTGGVYDVRSSYWSQFRRHAEEEIICDACMWDDPLYVELYGSRRQAQ